MSEMSVQWLCVRAFACLVEVGSDTFIRIERVNVCCMCVSSLETCRKCVSVFGANGNLRTEASGVFRNGELTEDRQAPAAGLAASTGLGASE